MTPQAWFSANKGKALLVPGQPSYLAGQCEQAVDCYIHDALGLPYVYTPNAHDFWDSFNSLPVLNQNFDKVTDQFLVGDIVIYASNLPGSHGSGHIDICAAPGSKSSYLGYDSNWGGDLTLHQVAHTGSPNTYILGSLRLKGDDPAMQAEIDALSKQLDATNKALDAEIAARKAVEAQLNTTNGYLSQAQKDIDTLKAGGTLPSDGNYNLKKI